MSSCAHSSLAGRGSPRIQMHHNKNLKTQIAIIKDWQRDVEKCKAAFLRAKESILEIGESTSEFNDEQLQDDFAKYHQYISDLSPEHDREDTMNSDNKSTLLSSGQLGDLDYPNEFGNSLIVPTSKEYNVISPQPDHVELLLSTYCARCTTRGISCIMRPGKACQQYRTSHLECSLSKGKRSTLNRNTRNCTIKPPSTPLSRVLRTSTPDPHSSLMMSPPSSTISPTNRELETERPIKRRRKIIEVLHLYPAMKSLGDSFEPSSEMSDSTEERFRSEPITSTSLSSVQHLAPSTLPPEITDTRPHCPAHSSGPNVNVQRSSAESEASSSGHRLPVIPPKPPPLTSTGVNVSDTLTALEERLASMERRQDIFMQELRTEILEKVD